MFSNRDTIIAGLVFLIPPAVFNLSIYFLKDIVVTLILYIIIGLWLTPILLKQIINKDPYVVLTYKNLFSSDRGGKTFKSMTTVLLIVTLGLSIVAVWFRLLSGFDNIVLPAPLFSTVWLNYVYLLLVIVNFLVAISLEHKLYYGVVTTFLPDNVIGYLGIAMYQTLHYLALAFVMTTDDAFAGLLIALFFLFFLSLYILKEKENYNSSALAHQVIALANLMLLAVFVGLKYNGKYSKGISVANSSDNIINKMIR